MRLKSNKKTCSRKNASFLCQPAEGGAIHISLIFSIGLFIVLSLFVIFPLIKAIKENSQQLLSEKKARASFSEDKRDFRKSKDIYQKLEPDLKKVEEFFVSSEVPIEFIDFLEKTSFDSEILIEILSVNSGSTKDDNWPFLNLRLEAFGSFPDFLKFTEKLENSLHLIEISELTIKKLSRGSLGAGEMSGSSAGDIAASFSLKVFAK